MSRSSGERPNHSPRTSTFPRTNAELELAIGGSAPRDRLRRKGWHIRDPLLVSNDVPAYERYIHESKSEFSLAKHAYVVTRSGSFSERRRRRQAVMFCPHCSERELG